MSRKWAGGTIPGTASERRSLIVEIRDLTGTPVEAYRAVGCRPSVFQALPDLDADANAVAIHLPKLDCERWERQTA
ncbi:phage tail protein [Ancylobacter sp. Lp-2]|uniref:phage tail protein n=1 Tax=Ancylobacter sp. Lp-2 TaxID=2881339 RepID=UPI00351D15B5|nr:phage tail protein [Ancylobacter sp. Lp-2]